MYEESSLYMKGEEKFGPFSSRFYTFFATFSYRRMYGPIRNLVSRKEPSSILDVGCGPAHILMNLAEDFNALNLYGVDPSPTMISIAARRAERKGLGQRVSVVPGSSRKVPFDRKFDMIISSLSFHHWKDRRSALEYLLGFLSSKGTLAVFEMNGDKFPGKVPGIRKHSMSRESISDFVFDGYRTDTETSSDGKVLIFTISPE